MAEIAASAMASENLLLPLLKTANIALVRLAVSNTETALINYLSNVSFTQTTSMNIEITMDPLIDYRILRPYDYIRTGS